MNDKNDNSLAGRHSLSLENRALLKLTGVTDIDNFDESQISLFTQQGELLIKGKNLHINELSVESGDLTVEGDIWALNYGEKERKSKVGLFKKALR